MQVTRNKTVKLLSGLVILAVSLSGCASQKIDMAKVKAVIDVRTASEYAAGHLQGAINIDVESAAFQTGIETLTKADNYVVYCHSGRRAGLAIDAMKQDGFTGILTNAGGIDAATTATNLPIVTN